MRTAPNTTFHLTYCTNIHPANGWSQVYANLQHHVPPLKNRLSPHAPFGLGLRLSGRESSELLQNNHLQQLQNFLQEHNLYIFTLNGFPHGPFHRQPIKALVHAPDWRSEERVAYTLRLIDILAYLLPANTEGSISTSPLTYKAWINADDTTTWQSLTHNIVRIAQALTRVKRERNKLIYLAIEPEPGGLLQTSEEVVQFYTNWLLAEGAHTLSHTLAITPDEARRHLLEHIRICLDTCHIALTFENPQTVLHHFNQIGIKIGKVQLSSAPKIIFPPNPETRADIAHTLETFAESTYLHQVVQQNQDTTLHHYPDLPQALPHIHDPHIAQWRIHFHIPIFIDHFPQFQSTQDTITDTLALLKQKQFCHHLEIETYTWSVLPDPLKKNILDSITREYEWVLKGML